MCSGKVPPKKRSPSGIILDVPAEEAVPPAILSWYVAARLLPVSDRLGRENVNYEVPIKHKRGDPELRKPLLAGVTGYIKPGSMIALMGSSGAGKTTLLNLLSQRLSGGYITGNILINGDELDGSFAVRAMPCLAVSNTGRARSDSSSSSTCCRAAPLSARCAPPRLGVADAVAVSALLC